MATQNVNLPDIGEGVTEGELVKWLVQKGDKVESDQPIAEVMTDKATVEVPSPFAGTVVDFKASEGDMVPIESPLLALETEGGAETATEPQEEALKEEPQPEASKAEEPAPAAVASGKESGNGSATQSEPTQPAAETSAGSGMEVHPPVAESRVLATPGTRRLAREAGVDINEVDGTGNAGRVTREDVLQARRTGTGATAAGQPSVQAPTVPSAGLVSSGEAEKRVAMRGIRRKIAENMQMAKRVVPHFTLMEEANVTRLVRVRQNAKQAGEKYGVKVTFLPFVIKALIATLREFPELNSSIDDESSEIVYKNYVNVGFAADTPNGLLVPVIKNADQKSILQLSQEISELAAKARDGKLSMDEMKGATITITNIGSVGGTYATPIINHPEVAIIGIYKIQDKPVLRDGKFRAAKVMNYTVTCDHRLIDGAVAARFMSAFVSRIENPSELMLNMV